MAVYRKDDKHRIRSTAKKASTAIAVGEILTVDTNGFALPAVAASTNLIGVSAQRVGTDSSDYASATPIAFDAPRAGDRFVMSVTGGTPAQTNVGEFFDLSNSTTVDMAASTLDHVKLVELRDSTSAVFEFNPTVVFSA